MLPSSKRGPRGFVEEFTRRFRVVSEALQAGLQRNMGLTWEWKTSCLQLPCPPLALVDCGGNLAWDRKRSPGNPPFIRTAQLARQSSSDLCSPLPFWTSVYSCVYSDRLLKRKQTAQGVMALKKREINSEQGLAGEILNVLDSELQLNP